MNVTLNVILAGVGPSTRDNVYSALARVSARRAAHPMMQVCGMLRTGPAEPMDGHNEAPFLDGRGLRVGPAKSMVYPAPVTVGSAVARTAPWGWVVWSVLGGQQEGRGVTGAHSGGADGVFGLGVGDDP